MTTTEFPADGGPYAPNYELVTNPLFSEGIEEVVPRRYGERRQDGSQFIETVDVHLGDDSVIEDVHRLTTAFAFRPVGFTGATVVLTIERAHHIMSIHMGEDDSGSVFYGHQSLEEILGRLSMVMPPEVSAVNYHREATAVVFGDQIGWEGLASIDELVENGTISDCDKFLLEDYRKQIIRANLTGTTEYKQKLVRRFNAKRAAVFLKIIRPPGNVVIPHVVGKGKPTNTATVATTTRWNFASWRSLKYINTFFPSRPSEAAGQGLGRHPIPGEHRDRAGSIDRGSFDRSAWNWSTHALLVPKRD